MLDPSQPHQPHQSAMTSSITSSNYHEQLLTEETTTTCYHHETTKLEDLNEHKFRAYKLDPFDRTIFRLQDERDDIQKRTFTKWVNQHLQNKGLCVNDLYEDFKDGTRLIALLEQLTNRTLIKQKGHMKFHSLENIQTCLDFLKQHRIKLINIHKEEIANGNPKITLGLIWILILYFQISADDPLSISSSCSSHNNKDEMNAQQTLLSWCQENLRGYESVRCKDLSASWRDGRVLCAILNRHRPDKISFTESFQRSNIENLRAAFDLAESEFGVPRIIEPEDMDVDHPDEKSVMTYVSMLFNAMPNIPPHPSEVKLESYKRALLEEYAIICRSLMRWLRDSISTMDNRTVPNNIIEIKSLLNDVKTFRLEEYATRLKEKKKLLNLYDEITSLPDSENLNVENEIKSIEKVWHKFDNYIQLRENLLEKTYRKYEHLQLLIQKIDKLYENCDKQLQQIESDFIEMSKQLSTMNSIQIKSCNDRFEDLLRQCDHDLRKMFIECQHLKDEEHNEAEYYHKKINQLQNRSLELRSHILNELDMSRNRRSTSTHAHQNGDGVSSIFTNYLNWIENKKKSIQTIQSYPSELNEIEREIGQTNSDLNEIKSFRDKYLHELSAENDPNNNNKIATINNDNTKYNLNELEIAYNLLYNMANFKLKCLKQLEEFVKLVNEQLYRLDQIEELELTRDWSSPHKLSYSSLLAHKKTLDEDLKMRSMSHIDPINSYGRALIADNHPAASHVRTYLDTVNQHLEWVKQLSYLLGVHLKSLGEWENFNNQHGALSEKLDAIKTGLSNILTSPSGDFGVGVARNSVDSIEKMRQLRRELDSVRAEIDNLLAHSQRLTPFTMRRQKLKPPYNRCKCLIPYKKATLSIQKDEECLIEDNTQRIKWKVIASNGQTGLVPSVCFQLPPVDEDSVDFAHQLKTKCENLSKQTHSCEMQLRKDRLFDMMNVIKFCELDEFEHRKINKSSSNNDREGEEDLESILNRIKIEMESLQRELTSTSTTGISGSSGSLPDYQTSDMRMILETYDKCVRRVSDLSERSTLKDEYTKTERELQSTLDSLESRLAHLRGERLAQLRGRSHSGSNLDKLISLYQDFERTDLKPLENEIENAQKRVDGFENMSYRHQRHGSSGANSTCSSSALLRQRLDSLQMEVNAIRNDTNANVQNINMVKVLIGLLENADKWLLRTEERLSSQEKLKTMYQLPTCINRLLYELEEVESLLKQKQDDISKVRSVSEKIEANRNRIGEEVSNLGEILDSAEDAKQRFKFLFNEISNRVMMLQEIQEAYELYETQHKRETKWIKLLRKQVDDHELKQHLLRQQKYDLRRKYQQAQSHSQQQYESAIPNEDDFAETKSSLDTSWKIYTELNAKSTQIERLNESGIQLIKFLRRFNQSLADYRRQISADTDHSSSLPPLVIVESSSLSSSSADEILNQLRHELNSFNREYSNFISEYNQKLKQLSSTVAAKSDNKQYSVQITALINQQNADSLIEKYSQDVYDRFELDKYTNNLITTTTTTSTTSSSDTTLQPNRTVAAAAHQPNTEYHYYYTDENESTIDDNELPTTTTNTSVSSYASHPKNLVKIVSSNINNTNNNNITHQTASIFCNTPSSSNTSSLSLLLLANNNMPVNKNNPDLAIIEYPLSFYDAVNHSQLDLITGCLKPNNTFLADAIRLNLLNPKSAYVVTPGHAQQPLDLAEAIRKGVITSSNKVFVAPGTTLTLSDALKQGYLKLEPARSTSNVTHTGHAHPQQHHHAATTTSCSVSSETQSMSVKSIRDPNTGELLAPTEAIKRRLLDPYKGLFVNTATGEQMPISEAIQKGFVIVEMISPAASYRGSTAGETSTDADSNVVSTSLIRETKSYHLLAVYDPTKNDEVSIKEAINRGILDRRRGLYVHPVTRESFSISDAINKGVIRARVITPPSTANVSQAPHPHHHHLVSSNRFEENRSYTITAAIDPRTRAPIGLSQAMRDGIIDAKNGTYVNVCTGEVISINKAIELKLVLTDADYSASNSRSSSTNNNNNKKAADHQTSSSSLVRREMTTLNIESVRDVRTGRMVSVSEAMQLGLLDRNTLNYCNPLTQEVLSLARAHERGYVQGHYTDASSSASSSSSTSNLTSTATHRGSVNEESYFIIDIFDPRTNKSVTLDQAIASGLFDHSRGVYIHPLSGEQVSLGDAVRKGLVQAQSFGTTTTSEQQPATARTFDPRLPIGAFGIDKQIKSMRTKFNRDGTSVLQIDIESTRPTRGVYEVDEIEEFTVNEKLDATNNGAGPQATTELRRVVDINSVHRVDNPPNNTNQQQQQQQSILNIPGHELSTSSSSTSTSTTTSTSHNIINNLVHEKNILKVEVNKDVTADIKIHRYEDVVEDDNNNNNNYYSPSSSSSSSAVLRRITQQQQQQPGIARISVDSNNNNQSTHTAAVIPERKTNFDMSEHVPQRVQTLVIDDANNDKYSRRAVNIEGQTHVQKNEVQINEQHQRSVDLLNSVHHQQSVHELNRKIELLERERGNQVKVRAAEVVDTRVPSKQHRPNVDLDTDLNNQRSSSSTTTTIQKNVKITVDIKGDDERPRAPRAVQTIVDDQSVHTSGNRVVYEDSHTVDGNRRVVGDDDEESFEEWTEVYTITVRGVRYKILWVYDSLKNERVTLGEAVTRGIIDVKKSTYHNLKTSYSSTINEAVDDGLIGIEEDNTALILKVNGITYTIYWLWDPVRRKRVAPKRAIERGVLDLDKLVYRNYQTGEGISIHEAVYLKLIGASDDLTSIEEELVLEIEGVKYKIAWIKDSRSGEKYKPRDALRHGLLDLTNYLYNKYDTNESLTIPVAIEQHWIGLSELNRGESSSGDSDSDTSSTHGLNRQDSLLSLDDEELTIKTKTAIYVITGLLHPETQKEIKVSEAIKLGILAPDTGAYKDFKTNVVYEVGEAINEGIVFATVTDLLQDEQASTEFLREEIKRFIVKSVIDPRSQEKIGGLQAQAAGILNYAQGVYTNPDTGENIPISEAIARNYINVTLQEETAHEEFDAEVVTETLMERRVTNYRILGVLDPFSNELISASEAVNRQIIDTETNAYVDASVRDACVPIKEAVRRNLVRAEVSESIERKPLGLTLQNAIRLGLYNPDTGKFKDLYSNRYFELNQAIEKGHINPNGAAVADSSSGAMTLNEAFSYSIISKRTGILDRQRLLMFKGKMCEAKIYKWNFEDAVKCGMIALRTGRYRHQQTGELLSIKDAINRGLIDGETTVIETNPETGQLMTLRSALDTHVHIDEQGNVIDVGTQRTLSTLEQAFNSRKIISAFDENTGEIYLPSLGKIVPFEKAIRRKKMDKSVKIFDPKSNRDLTINDAIERAIIDKTSGMIIDPKGCGGLLSIKEAVKRGIVSITGAPVVTGHHNSETIEAPTITSRKHRHFPPQKFDDVVAEPPSTPLPIVKSRSSGGARRHHHHHHHQSSRSGSGGGDASRLKSASSSRIGETSGTGANGLKSKSYTKTPIIYDAEFLESADLLKEIGGGTDSVDSVTTLKTTNEEHRKKISGQDVTERVKSNFKETVLAPGELPKVTATANYEKETKSRLDETTTTPNSGNK